MINMNKLTPEQRQFAEENHNLVLQFLNKNCLDENEFYDIVIFGFLLAIKKYFENDKLKKYSFSTIAWNTMRSNLKNHYKSQYCPKHQANIASLHALEESIAATDSLMIELETELLLHTIASAVSEQQMRIIRMKKDGYPIKVIAKNQKLKMKTVEELLTEARNIVEAVCYG